MKLIKPSYQIITPINGEEVLKQIELAARTCYKSEDKIDFTSLMYWVTDQEGIRLFQMETTINAISAKILIKKLIEKGHYAMLEFGGMITVKFICDRGVSHELVRHRLCSFAQESTRYCNYGNDEHIQFIIPCWSNITEDSLPIPYLENVKGCTMPDNEWLCVMENAEESYNVLIKQGWQPQQARSVLPNSLKTEINMSANLREWREIFKQRTAKAAHMQMRELMIPLLVEFKQRIPIIFDDIIVKD